MNELTKGQKISIKLKERWRNHRKEILESLEKRKPHLHTKEYKKWMSKQKKQWWKETKKNPEKLKEIKKKIGEASKGRIQGMEKHPSWKGGRYIDSRDGYVFVRKKDAIGMRNDGYIVEHRYIMEKFLKRPLTPLEEVHHKNGVKTDNRIENLELVVKKFHYGEVICPFCSKQFKVK